MSPKSPPHQYHYGSDEAAGAKIWSVYIAEAEKYDRALVASWRADMEGILIFAGLFSAVLTAFIVESYKMLSPDQSEPTVLLLATLNGTPMEIHSPQFRPSPISVACNALWFLSLALSLSSALIATLVEQWARNFLQRTEMRPSPIIRARILSYLYYGLKNFHMHAVVEIVPLLLHSSLFLFFSGLVAFLLPINTVVTSSPSSLASSSPWLVPFMVS
ncbi:hypothetical protein C8R46DRAFT_1004786 [Mycena filopes]|nr:hypothetical protein C8R46DRAFT_1004786 [Mycena filopes]